MPGRRKKVPQQPQTAQEFVAMWYGGYEFAPQTYEDFGFFDQHDVQDVLGTQRGLPGDPRDFEKAVELVTSQMEQFGTGSTGFGDERGWQHGPQYQNLYNSPYFNNAFRPTRDRIPSAADVERTKHWQTLRIEQEKKWREAEAKLAEERKAGYYKPEEVESYLQNITYDELPQSVRDFFEKEFAEVISQDPGLMDFVKACQVDFKLKGPEGQIAEHLRAQNHIEWYGNWRWDADRISKLYTPEQVRATLIERFLNMTMVHELAHIVQDYFKGQNPKIAPYPDEEHPEYREFGEVYKNDPGEQHATGVAKRYVDHTIKQNPSGGYPRFYSLLSFRGVFGAQIDLFDPDDEAKLEIWSSKPYI